VPATPDAGLSRPAREPSFHDDSYERVDALASIDLNLDRLVRGLPEEQRIALLARVVAKRDYGDIAAEPSATKRPSRAWSPTLSPQYRSATGRRCGV
jgi:DNA-directed RNA polymerase specialized sigma24 family protein